VDLISDIDLAQLLKFHTEQRALATLVVQKRESSRQLLFSHEGELGGRWISGKDPEFVRPTPNLQAFAFSGIHAVSPQLLSKITEQGVFSIIPTYLRLAEEGQRIMAFHADESSWRDLGRLEDLQKAETESR